MRLRGVTHLFMQNAYGTFVVCGVVGRILSIFGLEVFALCVWSGVPLVTAKAWAPQREPLVTVSLEPSFGRGSLRNF